ncbi:hypothetical protein BT96DRAFT_459855 [Gymnopus androsaceus JB14]|uniref:Uncharacterized protein n=1 Tax=Gymnopus androsaceus JB14 TaxID=1447944 RepID=A0A6A4IJW0_9AGAR|nr:hypothetical protein BT96DRAFT_459855 [Gymnopus androsaceus JB14]
MHIDSATDIFRQYPLMLWVSFRKSVSLNFLRNFIVDNYLLSFRYGPVILHLVIRLCCHIITVYVNARFVSRPRLNLSVSVSTFCACFIAF